MLGKLIPLLIALIGLGAGVGAGIALRPGGQTVAMVGPCGDVGGQVGPADSAGSSDGHGTSAADAAHEYVKLNNQFVVPVVADGRVGALVVMSLSLEVPPGETQLIYEREPKLRDALLRVMFDHANAGGFDGAFTSSSRMDVLRSALLEAAVKTAGPSVSDVLITDIVRQDA